MFTLVIGGTASGKSAYAESLAAGHETKLYIATMQPYDSECLAKIEKHRSMRSGAGFETAEIYGNLHFTEISGYYGVILLECVSNLLANELFGSGCLDDDLSQKGDTAVRSIIDFIRRLKIYTEHLVVVSNDIMGSCGDTAGGYSAATILYMELLAKVNRLLCEQAHNVCEVVYSIPLYHKGFEAKHIKHGIHL